jgi:hypothetical protein
LTLPKVNPNMHIVITIAQWEKKINVFYTIKSFATNKKRSQSTEKA